MTRINPLKTFYLAYPLDDLEGRFQIGESCAFHSEGDAIAFAREAAESASVSFAVLECTPRKRVYKPAVAVEPIDAPTDFPGSEAGSGGGGSTCGPSVAALAAAPSPEQRELSP